MNQIRIIEDNVFVKDSEAWLLIWGPLWRDANNSKLTDPVVPILPDHKYPIGTDPSGPYDLRYETLYRYKHSVFVLGVEPEALFGEGQHE